MTSKPHLSSAARWAAATLLLALALTTLACRQIEQRNAETLRQAASQQAQRALSAIVERLQRYAYGLRGARGAVVAAGDGPHAQEAFHRYSLSRELPREFPGARGFGFVRRVPETELKAFAAAMRAATGFSVHQFQPYRAEHAIIQFIEPLAANR